MGTYTITDPEADLWLNNFKNKSAVLKRAVREFRDRHYEGVYFTEDEMLRDKKKYERMLKRSREKLDKINKLLEEQNTSTQDKQTNK